jgi:hypothetical protein
MKPPADKPHSGGSPRNTKRESLQQKLGIKKRQANAAVAEYGFDTVEELGDAKLLKEIAHAEKMAHDAEAAKVRLENERALLRKTKGELVEVASVIDQGKRLAAIVGAELASLCDDLPGSLEGLDAAQIRAMLIDRTEKLKAVVKQRLRQC